MNEPNITLLGICATVARGVFLVCITTLVVSGVAHIYDNYFRCPCSRGRCGGCR